MNKFFSLFFLIIFLNFNLFALSNIDNSSYINTENITYNSNENLIELGKNSLINIDDINILTNSGIIDYNNDKIEIFGEFYFYQYENILKGSNLIGNTKLTKFTANEVSYIYQNDLKIDSNKLIREDNEVYFNNNFLTPCELEGFFNCPTWSLKIPKTKYLVDEDKFIHYDSFLQLADKKIFYIPYFSHYGSKAPRHFGFLTPTIEFSLIPNNISGSALKTPVYIPMGVSSDLLITPKFMINPNYENISKNYSFNTKFEKRLSGGFINIEMDTLKNSNVEDFYNSLRFNTKQYLNKNNTIEFTGLLTNSVSSTRSINEEQITFDNTYIKLNTYDFISNNDLLLSRLNSATAYDNSANNLVPFQIPYIHYQNNFDLKDNGSIYNYLDLQFLKRDQSNSENPSESKSLSLKNLYFKNYKFKNNFITNKIILSNTIKELVFNHNNELNDDYYQTGLSASSDMNIYKFNNKLKLKIKTILNEDFNSFKSINEDSRSLSFSYNNLFEENRYYGNDQFDNTNRLVYGIENYHNINDINLIVNIGQSYDFKDNNNYAKKINQNDNFSDIIINNRLVYNNYEFNIDTRIDKKKSSKKEMNYSLEINNPFKININYNETSKEAFIDNSDDSKSLSLKVEKELNNSLRIGAFTNLDLKNKYQPYESIINLSLFDECSQLDIIYTNTHFSDNFNTTPKETIGLTFKMDYLGFFGYEQSTNLFFERAGNFSYGL